MLPLRNTATVKLFGNFYFFFCFVGLFHCLIFFYSLQQGFLLSSTQQMVDKLVAQTQDCIRSFGDSSESCHNEINTATALIRDANNSKQLLSHLHDVILRREDTVGLDSKLCSVSRDLHAFMISYIEVRLLSYLAPLNLHPLGS